jgi:TubC N-terminal docking domain
MNTAELLEVTARLGIELWAENGTLRFRPKEAMPSQLAVQLKASKPAVLDALKRRETDRQTCRLIGYGFPPCPTTIPPDSIRATPLAVCPRCSSRPVLPELRAMTGGLCWTCWTTNSPPAS